MIPALDARWSPVHLLIGQTKRRSEPMHRRLKNAVAEGERNEGGERESYRIDPRTAATAKFEDGRPAAGAPMTGRSMVHGGKCFGEIQAPLSTPDHN